MQNEPWYLHFVAAQICLLMYWCITCHTLVSCRAKGCGIQMTCIGRQCDCWWNWMQLKATCRQSYWRAWVYKLEACITCSGQSQISVSANGSQWACCDTYVHTARYAGAALKCHGADLTWLLSLQCCCRPKTATCHKFWYMCRTQLAHNALTWCTIELQVRRCIVLCTHLILLKTVTLVESRRYH